MLYHDSNYFNGHFNTLFTLNHVSTLCIGCKREKEGPCGQTSKNNKILFPWILKTDVEHNDGDYETIAEVGWYILGDNQQNVGPYAFSELRGECCISRYFYCSC